MSTAIKTWLVPMLGKWAAQKRQLLQGTNRAGDPAGWTSASVLERIKTLGDGADQASRGTGQRFSEVFRGDALTVARAMQGMPSELRDVLHLHYLVEGTIAWKAEQWGWTTAAYWRHLDGAYCYLGGRLDAHAERRRSPGDAS